MREIKFRAWNGRYMVDFDIWSALRGHHWDDVFGCEFDKDTPIMQYTGLHDKNGVEIFEGDIIETPQHKYIKKWVVDENHGGAFVLSNRLNTETYLDSDAIGMTIVDNCYHPDMSVIGNVHQNSELLEQ